MKMAKKLLAVAMVLSMIAAFTAIAFAAGGSVSFTVGDYADGKATVSVKLVGCVDLTSGSLNFGYEAGKVTKITKKNGTDAKNIGDIDNAFNSEFNADTNPAEFGFYFKNKLWDDAAWKAAAEELDQDAVVSGSNFECAQFVFTAEEGAVITVTGELKFGETAVAVNDSFKIGNGTIVDPDPGPGTEPVVENPCKAYLEKVAAKAATCTEAGNMEYYKCSVCGKTFSDAEAKNEISDVTIAAKGHTWGTPVVTKAATETEEGELTYTCTVCGATKVEKTEKLPATGCSTIEAPGKAKIGDIDRYGKVVIGFDPLTGRGYVGKDKNGNWIVSEDPDCYRTVVFDDSTSGSTPAGSSSSSSGTKTSSSSASSSSSATGSTSTSTGTKTTSASVKTDGGKKTGDNGVLAIIAGVVALAGAAFVVTKKRK